MRHAYLIQAHRNDYTFETLIRLLDDERNDIFIHMDTKNKAYHPQETCSICQKARVFHCDARSVSWGGYSQIDATLRLLSLATQVDKHSYYHLISGQDLPIKAQDFIHDFFKRNAGKEFVHVDNPEFSYHERVQYFWPRQEKKGRSSSLLNKILIFLQRMLRYQRNPSISFQKGTNWFSVTDDFARYVISKSDWIEKVFSHTKCADEIFIQTLIVNSPFVNHLYHQEFDDDYESIMRLIDWERGQPYVFRSADYEELTKSRFLYARKFDSSIDRKIIDDIAEFVRQ